MRKLLLPVLIFFIACNSKQADKKIGKNENTDYLVTLEGIGSVKTEMSQQELEKLLNKNVPLTNPTDTASGSWQDTATIHYKEAEIKLDFVRTYAYTAKDSFHMRVTRMTTNSELCKTIGGVGIGASKQEIIDAFDGYRLFLEPGYDNDTLRSKTLYSVKVRESREGPQIVFYLKNNKVYSIEVGSFFDDAE